MLALGQCLTVTVVFCDCSDMHGGSDYLCMLQVAMLKMQAMDYVYVLSELQYVRQLVKAIASLKLLLYQGV